MITYGLKVHLLIKAVTSTSGLHTGSQKPKGRKMVNSKTVRQSK